MKVTQLDFKEKEGITARMPLNPELLLHSSLCLKYLFNSLWARSLVVKDQPYFQPELLPQQSARKETRLVRATLPNFENALAAPTVSPWIFSD